MDMMKSFIASGAKVYAVGNEPEENWKRRFEDEGIDYLSIPVSRNGLNVLGDVLTFQSIRRIILAIRPDKIFTYQAKTIVYGVLAARSIDKNIECFPLVAGLGSIFRGHGIKNSLIKTILGLQYKLAFKFSIKVIFQNNDDKNELLNLKLLNTDKTCIINGSGVNLDKFICVPLPSTPAILYVGRLVKDKGIGEYLNLAQRIKISGKNIRCLLVGPFDSNPSALKSEELQPYIDNGIVEYFGEQSDVRPYLAQCTVYVLPSYHEGTPKSVLEAMATGRPIVTTDAPGCRETVSDNVNGFLVPIKDTDALFNAVIKIIDNKNIARKFSVESRRIAEEKYDVNKVNTAIKKIMRL
mgnify:FL=1